MNLNLEPLRFTVPARRTTGLVTLFYLSMESTSATAGTVFIKLKPLGVIPPVLGGGICPLPALGAGKANNNSGFGFPGHDLLYDAAN